MREFDDVTECSIHAQTATTGSSSIE